MSNSTNIELLQYAQKHKIPLSGVYSKDKLPNGYTDNTGIIINMADSNKSGTHWVSVYVSNNTPIYFDSYGAVPPREVINYMEKINKKNWVINKQQIQSLQSGYCGYYCIYFIKEMSINKVNSPSFKLNSFLKKFSIDSKTNLKLLKHYLNL